MNLSDLVRRLFVGSYLPSTEAVQRQILTLIEGNGPLAATVLYARIQPIGETGSGRSHIDQAAQILVNTQRAVATDATTGRGVDPVNAPGAYRLAILREEMTKRD